MMAMMSLMLALLASSPPPPAPLVSPGVMDNGEVALRSVDVKAAVHGEETVVDIEMKILSETPWRLVLPDSEDPSARASREDGIALELMKRLPGLNYSEATARARSDPSFLGGRFEPDHWALREVEVLVDGHPLRSDHVQAWRGAGWWAHSDGGWTFAVPKGLRVLRIRYRVGNVTDLGLKALSFDAGGLRSFSGTPEKAELRWEGLGDWPALLVLVSIRSGASSERGAGRWKFDSGTLLVDMQGRELSLLEVSVPLEASCRLINPGCSKGDGGSSDRSFCGLGRCAACSDYFLTPDYLARWQRSSESGRFDRRSLSLARNWIYARKGMRFSRKEVRDYFEKQPWYCPSRRAVALESADELAISAIAAFRLPDPE